MTAHFVRPLPIDGPTRTLVSRYVLDKMDDKGVYMTAGGFTIIVPWHMVECVRYAADAEKQKNAKRADP